MANFGQSHWISSLIEEAFQKKNHQFVLHIFETPWSENGIS
jgi:hypothetical protein